MRRRFLIFGAILLACGAGLAGAVAGLRGGLSGEGLRGAIYLGAPLLQIREPQPAGYRLLGGADVLIEFPSQDRVAPETFRCLLNGRDVTDQLTVGRNGVAGSVAPLLEGSNSLRLEVFGRSWWGGRYYQDSYDLILDARAPLSMDRA